MGDVSSLTRVVLSLKAFSVCALSRESAADGLVAVPGVSAWKV